MKKKKIYCMSITEYALLLFFLLNKKKINDITFIFNSNFSILIKEKIAKKYNADIKIIKRIKIMNILWLKLQHVLIFKNRKDILIYGQDHNGLSFFIKNDIYLLEDGIGNYRDYESLKKNINLSKIKKVILKILTGKKKIECFGRGDNVKKIYLTGMANIPKDIEHKVEIINLKKLWDEKTKEEKSEILDIFGIEGKLSKERFNNKIIFLTQPFYENNLLTYEEEISLYKKILKKYDKEKIIIKPHPREEKRYSDIFPELEILEGNFPFEFFNLLEIKFERAVTIMSSAVLNFGEGIPIDFYGTEIHAKLLERCGRISLETLKETHNKI